MSRQTCTCSTGIITLLEQCHSLFCCQSPCLLVNTTQVFYPYMDVIHSKYRLFIFNTKTFPFLTNDPTACVTCSLRQFDTNVECILFSSANPVGPSNDRTRPPDKRKLERNVASINKAIKEKETSLVSYQLLAVSVCDSYNTVACSVEVGCVHSC